LLSDARGAGRRMPSQDGGQLISGGLVSRAHAPL
jgi:hypothetical protein